VDIAINGDEKAIQQVINYKMKAFWTKSAEVR